MESIICQLLSNVFVIIFSAIYLETYFNKSKLSVMLSSKIFNSNG